MKNQKVFFLAAIFVLAFVVALQTTATPSYAVIRRKGVVLDVIPAGAPVATITYSPSVHQFRLRVTNVKKVTYVIAYNKQGSDIQEALQGSRRYKKATNFVANLYAGSQSSHYFIPHFVTNATLHVEGTDGQDSPFTIDQQIPITQPKPPAPKHVVLRRAVRKRK